MINFVIKIFGITGSSDALTTAEKSESVQIAIPEDGSSSASNNFTFFRGGSGGETCVIVSVAGCSLDCTGLTYWRYRWIGHW